MTGLDASCLRFPVTPPPCLLVCPVAAELWTRVRLLLKPGPDVSHYILTHFQWLWDIINSTFLRDVLMRLVITGLESEDPPRPPNPSLTSFCAYLSEQLGPTWSRILPPLTPNMATSTGSPCLTSATTLASCPRCQKTALNPWGSKVNPSSLKS